MKKAIIALLLVLPMSAFAGERDREQDPMHGPRMEQMMEKLELSESQRSQMADIMKRHHDKMMVLREATEAEVDKILTREQRQKLDNMKEKREERRQQRMEKEGNDKKGKGNKE